MYMWKKNQFVFFKFQTNDTYITLNCIIKGTTLLHVAINNKTVLKIIN